METVKAFLSIFTARPRGAALQTLERRLGSPAPTPALAILLGLACACGSFLIRFVFSRVLGEGEYFLTAFPFVLIVALVAGQWAGWSCLLFSLLGGWFFFIGEAFSFALGPYEGGILIGSLIVGAITVQVAALLRKAFAELEVVREKDRLLSRELEHRVKNTLTLVLSLSRQTFRKGSEVEAARAEFEGRVMALAAAQTLVGKTERQSALLRDIVERSMAPFCGGRGDRLVCAGPDVLLSADAAMGLCLVFHELATNAAKYGSLSTDRGEVRIAWRLADTGDSVAIHWQECDGPPVERRQRVGFGSQLFEKIVTRQLRGSGALDFPATGVQARITIPVEREPASLAMKPGGKMPVRPAPRRA